MGMKENWKLFIESCKAKADNHQKVAQYWDNVHNTLNLILIFISSITTALALLNHHLVPTFVTAAVSGITTILSAISGFLQPSQRRQRQMESSKDFRSLMLKMIRCETEKEYEELWNDYNKVILEEPFVPKKFQVNCNMPYSMTPELVILIDEKEGGVARGLRGNDDKKLSNVNDDKKIEEDFISGINDEMSEDAKLLKDGAKYNTYNGTKK